MVNIYKYIKGMNQDYELVVGNSMRRNMKAYGSFLYKKRIEQLSTAPEVKKSFEKNHLPNILKI
jgi:hypothetical protein